MFYNEEEPLDRYWEKISKTYKLVKKLGYGSSGEVVAAIRRDTKEPVAIKMIKIPKGDDNLTYL